MGNERQKPLVRVGVIGGGLMGREVASALARWFVLAHHPVRAELTAVCDVQPERLEWFRQVPTVRQLLAERAGQLGGRFGCATVDEAVTSHRLWAAALKSQTENSIVAVAPPYP